MSIHSSPFAVYCEFVLEPYFVIVHTRPRAGHERFDKYVHTRNLTELVISVIEQLTGGRNEILDKMCELDAARMAASKQRTRRYIATSVRDLYAPENAHLSSYSAEFKGYYFNTHANKSQAGSTIDLACKVVWVAYQSISEFPAFRVASKR